MYFNMNGGLGCFVVFMVFFLIMSLFGRFLGFLFTTPLGIVLLFAGGIYLFYKSRQRASMDVEKRSHVTEEETAQNETPFSRDAEDVDFKDIDD